MKEMDERVKTGGSPIRIKAVFLVMLLLSVSSLLHAQGRKITGKIVSEEDGEGVPGASVIIVGTSTGTITDFDGNYVLNVPNDETVLEIGFLGYQNQQVTVGARSVINVTLSLDITSLEEVVVIGYGSQKKKVVTAATAKVSGEDLEKRVSTNAFQAMQGQAAGINIKSSSGQPGSGFKVNIRGIGSISGSEPLYIVDGVQTGDIKYLNNSDIESIDVLKDGAAAAIYGSRAANGVVLITTKKGKAGKSEISFDAYYGVQNAPKKPNMLNAREYAQIMNEQHLNSGGSVSGLPFDVNNLPSYVESGSADTDWFDEMFVENAVTQNYTVGVTGGSDNGTYAMSLSYTGQEGIVGGSDVSNYERVSGRINTENKLYDGKLKVGENLTYSVVNSNGVAVGGQYSNSLRGAFNTSPLLPVYDDEGNYFNSNSNDYWNNTEASPYASMMLNNQNHTNNQKLLGNVYAELEIVKNLKLRSSFGFDYYNDDYRSYSPEYELSVYSFRAQNSVTQNMSKGRTFQFDNTLNYDYTAGKHYVAAMVGMSARDFKGSWMNGQNTDLVFDDFDHAWLTNATNQAVAGMSITGAANNDDKLLSYFTRVTYNYDEKYLFSAVFRADGSSKFAAGNRWGFFPSVSTGWVVSEEDFLRSVSFIDFMKFRVSWGQNGNQSIDAFQFVSPIKFDQTNYAFGSDEGANTAGAYPSRLSNEDIKWETSEQLDFGLDFRFLDNKLSFTTDFYQKTSKDWLIQAPVLATAGADAPYINGGNVINKGIEFELGYVSNINDFNYAVSANGAFNKNEVEEIPTEDGIIHGATNTLYANSTEFYRAQTGYAIGYFWGYQTDGLFQNEGEVTSYTNADGKIIQPNAKPGDVRYVDQNGDGILNDQDKVDLGNPNAPFTFGLNLSGDYKGFDFNISTFGTIGNEIVQSYRSQGDKYANYTTDVLNRWTGEGTSNSTPRVTNSNINYSKFSDLFVQDGSYYRISNVTVGYDFKALIKTEKFSQLRLYLAANNLFTFTNYTGMDPDVGFGFDNGAQDNFSSGIDLGFYPNPRTILLGANIKF